MRLQQRADACGLCAQLRPLLHYYCQLPGVQSPAALLQLRLDASRRSARRRGFTFITQDVTGPPGQGWRGGPFCKSRTSTAWECKRRQTRSGFRRVLSPPPRRSKRIPCRFRYHNRENNSQPRRAESLPERAGSRPDRPLCRASCRTLGPDTKTTARHWGGKEGRLQPARRTAAASSVSASWLQNQACGSTALQSGKSRTPCAQKRKELSL